MRIIAFLLVALLIAKDASYIGDRYVMRGISQGLCFLAGAIWILMHLRNIEWRRYTIFYGYFLVLLLTAWFSPYSREAFIQVASLATIVVFAIAAAEHPSRDAINRTVIGTTFIGYLIVCVVSLALIRLAPSIVYQIGDIAGDRRFSGLYGRPAMLGGASGVLLGIALFHDFKRSLFFNSLRIVAIVSGLACLWLSGARTFWVGFVCALPVIAFLKYESRSKLIISVSATAVVFVLVVQIFQLTISKETKEEKFRVGSVSTLTGRTVIWQGAFQALKERPLTGFGFGMAGVGMATGGSLSTFLIDERARNTGTDPTLHSGYVQAFGDSGIVGGFLYSVIIGWALFMYLLRRNTKAFPSESFIVLFCAIANIAESIVFKASVWHSALLWYLLVLGLSLREQRRRITRPVPTRSLMTTHESRQPT